MAEGGCVLPSTLRSQCGEQLVMSGMRGWRGGGTWRQEAFFSEHYLMQTCKNDLLRPAQTKLYNGPNIQGHCPPSAGGWGLRNQAGHKRKHFLCMLEL